MQSETFRCQHRNLKLDNIRKKMTRFYINYLFNLNINIYSLKKTQDKVCLMDRMKQMFSPDASYSSNINNQIPSKDVSFYHLLVTNMNQPGHRSHRNTEVAPEKLLQLN